MTQREGATAPPKPKVFYGYIVVAGVFVVMMISMGTLATFGVYFGSLLDEFGWTRTATSGAFSLYAILTGMLSVIMGNITDKVGPRKVVTGCAILSGAGYALMSQVSSVWQLYLFYGVITAAGMSGGMIPALSLVARWFVKRRGLMTAVAMAAQGAGGIIMPPLANWLIASYGWRTAYIVQGAITLVLILAAAQVLKRDPSQLGLAPYGAGEHPEAVHTSAKPPGLSVEQALRTRQFWLMCALAMLFSFTFSVVMVHIPIAGEGLGMSAAAAAAILSLMFATEVVGKMVWGGAVDRIGYNLVLVIGFGVGAASVLWFTTAVEPWMFYVFAAVFGVAHGCWVGLPPLAGNLFGLRSHGAFIGFAYLSSQVGNMVGPVLAGYIFDATGSYRSAWIMISATAAASAVITVLIWKAGSPRRLAAAAMEAP